MTPYYCRCGQALFCENTRCGNCGRRVAFEPLRAEVFTLDDDDDGWVDADGATHERVWSMPRRRRSTPLRSTTCCRS